MCATETNVSPTERPSDVSWLWFDYTEVPASVSKFLKGQAERIRRSAGKSIIEMGKDLIAAKHYLSHGAFLRWVVSEVGMPARTAQAYMQVAHWASGRNANVALLPPTLLYLLSASGTPKEFIADVLKRTEAGERITLPAIREELKALRGNRRGSGHKEEGETHRNATSNQIAKVVALHIESETDVMEAVRILGRALPAADFDRVRKIMTSKSVLEDPYLPRRIEMAFMNVDAAQAGLNLRQHAPPLPPLAPDVDVRDHAVDTICVPTSS